MKRQATKYLALTMSAIMAVSLAACGDGSDSSADAALTPVEAEPILSDLELEILNLETKYNKGEFEQADYLALADAYHRAGYIRKQRDILEQDYRLYNDTDAFAALQELSINLEEETDSIRERAQEMQHDLELPEYLDESVNLIDSEDWFLTMMPKLKEGQRNYYLEQNNEPVLYAQVGYTEDGQCFSKVWYTGSQADRFLIQEGATIRMVTVTPAGTAEDTTAPETGTEEGAGTDAATATESLAADIQDTVAPTADAPANIEAWNGSFEAWTMDCATGNIIHEQGTLQNGVLTGEYTCNVYNGDGPLEAYSLWSSREEREYITYTGTFDAEGKILTEQPSEDVKKKLLEGTEYIDLILYAYDADGENCLWQGIGAGESAEDYRFGQEMIGLEIRPEYTSYEMTEDMTDAANSADTADNTTSADSTGNVTDGTTGDVADIAGGTPQIRIYDGEVQWFDGTYWVSAGSVREMAKQDPFAAYEENHATGATGGTGSITGSANGNASNTDDGQNITGNTSTAGDKTGGSIQKPTPTPAATAKPATKPATSTPKPAAKPVATAKPTPAPTQAPAHDDHDDNNSNNNDNNNNDNNNNDNNNNNNSDNNSNNDNNSGDSGNNGGNSGGNDVDVEWTPDLM